MKQQRDLLLQFWYIARFILFFLRYLQNGPKNRNVILPEVFLNATQCYGSGHLFVVCVAQEEQKRKDHIEKHQNAKLLYLIAKAAEHGKVDMHLSESFIHRW